MKHRQISRLLLTAGGIAFVGAAFLMFVYAPILGQDCAAMYPELSYLYWPMLIGVWALGLVYLPAVALYMRISLRIGQNRSFCPENVRGMQSISRLLAVAAAVEALVVPGLRLAGIDLGGPVWLMLLLLALATAAVALLAYCLSALLHHAVQLQEDSDLTV